MILAKSQEYPEADILIHPESNCSHDDRILNLPQAYMYSTAGMIRHAALLRRNNLSLQQK